METPLKSELNMIFSLATSKKHQNSVEYFHGVKFTHVFEQMHTCVIVYVHVQCTTEKYMLECSPSIIWSDSKDLHLNELVYNY